MTSVSVVVPTFRRPHMLRRCLVALTGQTRPPDEVVVVLRVGDHESYEVARGTGMTDLRIVQVEVPGVLAAMRVGVAATTGAIVAFTDDDAEPAPDWIERLLELFADPGVGAVGGRDVIAGQTTPRREDVGRLTSAGRLIGNHHLGVGPPRDVDTLKGVNMAFRSEALALPRGGVLRGDGAEVYFEVLSARWAAKSGRRVVYDPALEVVHHAAARVGEDQRGRPSWRAIRDAAHNYVLATSLLDRARLPRQAAYALAIGSRDAPGVARSVVGLTARDGEVLRRALPSFAGSAMAIGRLVGWGRRESMLTCAALRSGAARPALTIVAHDIHDRGGMERAYAELIRRLVDTYEVTVVSTELDASLRPLVTWHRVAVLRRPFPLRFALFFLAGGRRLARVRTGVVHTLGAIVPNRVDVAHIQFCHAGFVEATGRLAPRDAPPLRRLNTTVSRFLALRAERWCYRPERLRSFAAVSEGVAGELAVHYPGVPASIVPNGVDPTRYRRDEGARQEIRLAERVAEGEPVAVFVGGDWDRKGLPLVISALSAAPKLRLWVVGAGDEGRARADAARAGVEERVRFFGPRTDAERLYSAADIFVLASLYETFSIAAHEGAASALPIVSTRVSGITELVGADEAGVLVDRDPASIGAALRRLCDDPGLRERLGAEAHRRGATKTWDRAAEAMLALNASLIDGRRPVDHGPDLRASASGAR